MTNLIKMLLEAGKEQHASNLAGQEFVGPMGLQTATHRSMRWNFVKSRLRRMEYEQLAEEFLVAKLTDHKVFDWMYGFAINNLGISQVSCRTTSFGCYKLTLYREDEVNDIKIAEAIL